MLANKRYFTVLTHLDRKYFYSQVRKNKRFLRKRFKLHHKMLNRNKYFTVLTNVAVFKLFAYVNRYLSKSFCQGGVYKTLFQKIYQFWRSKNMKRYRIRKGSIAESAFCVLGGTLFISATILMTTGAYYIGGLLT